MMNFGGKILLPIVLMIVLMIVAMVSTFLLSGGGKLLSPSFFKMNTETAALRAFSKQHVCPEERLVVEKDANQNMVERMGLPSPPVDIRDDPDRLAMWEAQNASGNQFWREHVIYTVHGCGTHATYGCWCPNLKKGGRFRISGSGSMQDFCTCQNLD